MKKLIVLSFIFAIFVVIVVGIGGYLWWGLNTTAPSSDDALISFIIPKGRSASEIGNSLYKQGFIKNPLAFKVYVQVTNKSKKLNTGEFELSKNLSLYEVVDALGKGPVEVWVTIPEGLRNEEVAEKISSQLETKNPNFVSEFIEKAEDFQGYLFPDTYLFARDVAVDKVIQTLNSNFEKKYSQLNNKTKHSKSEIVTMASIIERETRSDTERPIVAGILWKRLVSEGWLIQADATVQYAIGSLKCKRLAKCDWWPVLSKEDLEINSLYNTYKNKTLPPTPIANPGLKSLSAAANPEESEYWFYIHDKEGSIHYATDIAGHNANIAKYLGK